METYRTRATFATELLRSQPTYKEWKHGALRGKLLVKDKFPAYLQGMETPAQTDAADWLPGSQPTYKEWKLRLRQAEAVQTRRSQPTYKEWKLLMCTNLGSLFLRVPSLPTRNGN